MLRPAGRLERPVTCNDDACRSLIARLTGVQPAGVIDLQAVQLSSVAAAGRDIVQA